MYIYFCSATFRWNSLFLILLYALFLMNLNIIELKSIQNIYGFDGKSNYIQTYRKCKLKYFCFFLFLILCFISHNVVVSWTRIVFQVNVYVSSVSFPYTTMSVFFFCCVFKNIPNTNLPLIPFVSYAISLADRLSLRLSWPTGFSLNMNNVSDTVQAFDENVYMCIYIWNSLNKKKLFRSLFKRKHKDFIATTGCFAQRLVKKLIQIKFYLNNLHE